MTQISIQVKGSKQAIKKLQRIAKEIVDFRAEMREVGQYLAKYYSTMPFVSAGGVYGAGWPKLSPKYAVRKAMLYPGRPMLQATGKMANSFAFQSGASFSRVVNNDPKFVYHQSSAARSKIPRRMMMAITDQHIKTIKTIIEKGIQDKLRSA